MELDCCIQLLIFLSNKTQTSQVRGWNGKQIGVQKWPQRMRRKRSMEKHIAFLCFTIVTFLFFNSCGQRAVETGATYANPILAGFYPDPSLCTIVKQRYAICFSIDRFLLILLHKTRGWVYSASYFWHFAIGSFTRFSIWLTWEYQRLTTESLFSLLSGPLLWMS